MGVDVFTYYRIQIKDILQSHGIPLSGLLSFVAAIVFTILFLFEKYIMNGR